MKSFIRNRIEGLIFLLVLPVLVLLRVSGLLMTLAHGRLPTGCGLIWKRWLHYVCRGFRVLRERWWAQYSLETTWSFYRYFLMVEVNAALDPGLAGSSSGRNLVVKLGHFGDTLHIVPMLRALKKAQPDTPIDLIVGPWCEALAKRIPYVDNVIVYAPALRHLNRGNSKGVLSFMKEWKVLRRIGRNGYELLVCTFTTEYIDLAMISCIKPQAWIGAEISCGLFEPFGNQKVVPFDNEEYDASRLLSQLEAVGIHDDDNALEFWVTPEEEATAGEILTKNNLSGYAVISPGSGWSGKNWSTESFSKLTEELSDRFGLTVVLSGGPDEASLGEKVEAGSKVALVNLIGKTGWGEAAAIIRGAKIFIGNDSGPMHLAAAMKTPSLSFFGPTSQSKWAPKGARHHSIRNVEECPGCLYWHPWAECIHENRCMKAITVDEAVLEVEKLLKAG